MSKLIFKITFKEESSVQFWNIISGLKCPLRREVLHATEETRTNLQLSCCGAAVGPIAPLCCPPCKT